MRVLLVPPLNYPFLAQTRQFPVRGADTFDWFTDLSKYGSSSSHSESGAPGTHLKEAFDHARQGTYDLVIHWNDDNWNVTQGIENLLTALASEPVAAGAFILDSENLSSRLKSRALSFLSGHPFSGWYATARAYRIAALSRIAYELNTYEAHFEVEVALQFLSQHVRIVPAISPDRRDTPKRAHTTFWPFLKATIKYRLQKVNLFYDFRFHPEHCLPEMMEQHAVGQYRQKFDADSPHRRICETPGLIPPGSHVLDIGCASGYVARRLVKEKGCSVVGIDQLAATEVQADGFDYYQIDLEEEGDRLVTLLKREQFDIILMLDVLEHLALPELFLLQLYRSPAIRNSTLIVSTGNVAFVVVRFMLFFGYFNYGNRGILDVTHKRLFSVRTFKNLLDQTGFLIREKHFFPVPFEELGFPPRLSRPLEYINQFLTRFRPSLFAYQMLFVAHSSKRFDHAEPAPSEAPVPVGAQN